MPVFSLFGVFPPVFWLEYRIFISIVDISANLENIDIDINKAILKISISIGLFWKISISIRRFWKILISISIRRFRKISISIKYRIDWNLAYRTGLSEPGGAASTPPQILGPGLTQSRGKIDHLQDFVAQ